jgi:hypothetical protein
MLSVIGATGLLSDRSAFAGNFASENSTNFQPVFGGMHQGHSPSLAIQQQRPADAEAAAASKRWAAMLQNGGFAMISGTPPPDGLELGNNGAGPMSSRSFTASGPSRSSSSNGREGLTEVRSTPDNLYNFAAESGFRGTSAGMPTIHSTPDNLLDFSSLSSELNASVGLSNGGMSSNLSPSAVYGEDAVQTLLPMNGMNGMVNQDPMALAARLQRLASFQKQQQQQQQMGLASFLSGSNGNLSALAAELAAAGNLGAPADGGLLGGGHGSSGNLEFNMSYPPPSNKALSSSLYIKVCGTHSSLPELGGTAC